MAQDPDRSERAIAAAEVLGLTYGVTRHGPVRSLAEAAKARGVAPSAVVKTIVVRLADDDYRFVLVPGDREIAWPKLRSLLGVNRLSMPDADGPRGDRLRPWHDHAAREHDGVAGGRRREPDRHGLPWRWRTRRRAERGRR